MRPFVYDVLPGRVVFGDGALNEVPNEVDALGAGTVMLIASRSSKPLADSLADRMGDRVVARIDEVKPHVPSEDVNEARRLAVSSSTEAVVTIGGGSAIGMGKYIALEAPVKHLTVPITYSGSEMTPIHGVTIDGFKRTGRDSRAKPHTVVYDPELSRGLSMGVTAGSVMNAMAHCVEALYAEHQNPVTSLMAMEGLRALRAGLARVVSDPFDREGRASLLFGSCLAGSALGSVGMAIHHKICHVLGGSFGLAHGDANAVILPHVVAANARAEPEVVAKLAEVLGVTDAALGLWELAASAGATSSLADLGMQAKDLDRAADIVVEHPGFNPRLVDRVWIRKLLQDAFEGKKPTATA
jgi:maleylacetate reductase